MATPNQTQAHPATPAPKPAAHGKGGDLKTRLEDAMSGQTLTPEQQDKLGKLFEKAPSDGKELVKQFRAIVPKGSMPPGQEYNVGVILAEQDGSQPPTPPPGMEPAEADEKAPAQRAG